MQQHARPCAPGQEHARPCAVGPSSNLQNRIGTPRQYIGAKEFAM